MREASNDNMQFGRLWARYQSEPGSRLFAPIADAFRRRGETEEAARMLRSGLEHHPGYVAARVLLAQCYQDLEQHDAAEAAFARVLEQEPDNLRGLRYRADRARERGDLDAALRSLRRAVEIDPFDSELLAELQEASAALEPMRGRPVESPPSSVVPMSATPGPTPESSPVLEPPPLDLERVRPTRPPGSTLSPNHVQRALEGSEDSWGARRYSEPYVEPQNPPIPEPRPSVGDRGHGVAPEPGRDAASDTFATLTLAGIYESQGYLEKALAIYDEMHRMHPDHEAIAARLGALQRRMAGMEPVPEAPPVFPGRPDEPPGTIEKPAARWRLLGTPAETAHELRRMTHEVRSKDISRRHTIIGTPPAPEETRRLPDASLDPPAPVAGDSGTGNQDFERFLSYVRSLKR